jgi:hypothetical protein
MKSACIKENYIIMANVVPVRKDLHKNLKVATKRGLEHIANQHIAPITAREYSKAANSFPIFLVNQPDATRYRSIVMLGLEAGENLYYKDERWNGTYLPQGVSMMPFGLGVDPDKEKTLTTYIDVENEYVGEDKENALFDAEGNDTEFYKSVQNSLGRLYENETMTEKFMEELAENDLLQELELHVNFSTGENKKLVGLFGIDEKKLQDLSDDKVLDFHKRGIFIPIHAMLGSIGQINKLAQLRNLSDNEQKVAGIQVNFAKETAEA